MIHSLHTFLHTITYDIHTFFHQQVFDHFTIDSMTKSRRLIIEVFVLLQNYTSREREEKLCKFIIIMIIRQLIEKHI